MMTICGGMYVEPAAKAANGFTIRNWISTEVAVRGARNNSGTVACKKKEEFVCFKC